MERKEKGHGDSVPSLLVTGKKYPPSSRGGKRAPSFPPPPRGRVARVRLADWGEIGRHRCPFSALRRMPRGAPRRGRRRRLHPCGTSPSKLPGVRDSVRQTTREEPGTPRAGLCVTRPSPFCRRERRRSAGSDLDRGTGKEAVKTPLESPRLFQFALSACLSVTAFPTFPLCSLSDHGGEGFC